MGDRFPTIRLAAAQASPILLDRDASGVDHGGPRRVCHLAEADGPDASTVSRRVAALADRHTSIGERAVSVERTFA